MPSVATVAPPSPDSGSGVGVGGSVGSGVGVGVGVGLCFSGEGSGVGVFTSVVPSTSPCAVGTGVGVLVCTGACFVANCCVGFVGVGVGVGEGLLALLADVEDDEPPPMGFPFLSKVYPALFVYPPPALCLWCSSCPKPHFVQLVRQ